MSNDLHLLPDDDSPSFMGEYERGLDAKGRITLPAPFREALGDEPAYLTRGLDRCLFLLPKPIFLELRRKVRNLSLTRAGDRRIRRMFFSSGTEIKPDGQGRVNIPQALRKFAELDGNVIVTGADTYIEIWNADKWAEMVQQVESSADHAEAWNDVLL